MACVMTAFFLADLAGGRRQDERKNASGMSRGTQLLLVGSALCLTMAAYGKPMLLALALPIVYRCRDSWGWKGPAVWTAAAVVSLSVLGASAVMLTERPWPYVSPRRDFSVGSPVNFMERRARPYFRRVSAQAETAAALDRSRTGTDPGPVPARPRRILAAGQLALVATAGGGFSDELLDSLERRLREFRGFRGIFRDSGLFLWGRHGGVLIYLPFAALAVGFFLFNDRRSTFGWLLFGSIAVVALSLIALFPERWLGEEEVVSATASSRAPTRPSFSS